MLLEGEGTREEGLGDTWGGRRGESVTLQKFIEAALELC